LNLWRYYPFPEGVGGVDRRVRAWEGTALSVERGRVVGKGSWASGYRRAYWSWREARV